MEDKEIQKNEAPKEAEKSRKEKKDAFKGLKTKVSELEADLAKEKDDYIRLMAEFENFRRRSAAERLDLINTASEKIILELLPVLDDCERALKALGESSDSDTPQPNTAYGKSKIEAEKWLMEQKELPLVILRPTGVYGPRETDYFLMAKSIKQHTDFAVGYTPQDITFVYVTDVVQAVFLAMEKDACLHKAYFLSDGEVYDSRTFSDLLKKEMGVRFVLRITAPVWFLRIVTAVGDKWGHITGKLSALNNDKFNILKQRNWRCDITPAKRDLGYIPQVKLPQGVHNSVAWYKDNGWL